jgi:MSHA biogenesis protein MshM
MALYLEHFGLGEPPFRITPHTDFFFDGADRGATLEALMYAIVHDEGIVKVSGEVGSGKTMLCRVLMERLPAQVETIYLATPSLARDEILHAIAEELELKISNERMSVALRELQEQLIRLYAAGRRVVILVDEAHVMPEETLEQVRLLSNLESNRHKLLQIVLFGQPELDATLSKPSLRQLRDRITHAFRMRPLSVAEVTHYISFRMRAAGYRGPETFSPRSSALIARSSAGLTRRINILADKSLLAAFTENSHGVAERHVRAAIADSEFAVLVKPRNPAVFLAAAAAAGIALGVGLHAMFTAAPVAPTSAVSPAPLTVNAMAAPVAAAPAPPAPSPAPPPAHLTEPQLRRLAGYAINGQQLLGARILAAREVLQRASDERYAIELFITDNADPARMERFLQRAQQMVPLAEVLVIPMHSGGQYRLRVVLGDFENREAAREASRRLPPKYQEAFHATPRSFAELRGQI